jgi:hypothetical protein
VKAKGLKAKAECLKLKEINKALCPMLFALKQMHLTVG